jgi:hypothetical protein
MKLGQLVLQTASLLDFWGAYISSNVGVTYLIKVIRRKGTCSTELLMKFKPPITLSSHIALSRSTTREALPTKIFMMMICRPIR